MAFILSLETSTEVCSVALHNKGSLLSHQLHQIEKSHSALLPTIVLEICKEAGIVLSDLAAIAVTEGPGSYTGLRIGVSSAKGFAYTLQKALISVPTMDIMLEAVRGQYKEPHHLCAMMDARRMEVYLKMEDQTGQVIWKTQPKILDENSFSAFKNQKVYICGNGMPKFRDITSQENLVFIDGIVPDAVNMGSIAYEKFERGLIENVAYFEPNYLKEWRTTTPKKKLL